MMTRARRAPPRHQAPRPPAPPPRDPARAPPPARAPATHLPLQGAPARPHRAAPRRAARPLAKRAPRPASPRRPDRIQDEGAGRRQGAPRGSASRASPGPPPRRPAERAGGAPALSDRTGPPGSWPLPAPGVGTRKVLRGPGSAQPSLCPEPRRGRKCLAILPGSVGSF